MTTTTLRLPPRIARLPQLQQIVRGGLAARGSIGAGLAAKAGGAAAVVPWWPVVGKTCVGAHRAKGADSYATSKVNLANPGTYDLADGTAYPTWDAATGWTLNGSTQYLVTPSSVSMSGSRSFLAVIKTPSAWATGTPTLFAHDSTARVNLIPRHSGLSNKVQMQILQTSWYQLQSGAALSTDAVHTIGFTINTSTSTLVLYVDGSAVSRSAPATLSINAPIYFGYSAAFSPSNFNGDIYSMAYYSDALTAGEVSTTLAAMSAL